ncbi:MAG: hypothetical protein LUI10_04750 [Lachnospiraceae bacterium]|nr:hypothetical protein [Lachnospiraceae bacterium]
MGKREKPVKKKKFLPIVIVAIVIVAAVLIAVLVSQGRNSENKGSDVSSNTETEVNDDAISSVEDDETTESGQDGSDEETATGDTDESESGTASESNGDNGNSGSSGSTSSQDKDGSSGTSGNTGTAFSFPYTSSLDELELVAVYNYSGYYIEDGSEDEIDSVAALEVTNLSDQAIEYATITLTADGKELNFEVSLLPAGETALVMEADKQSCSETASFSYGGSEIASLSSLDLCEDQVTVSTDSGAVTVTNISGNDISELRLFYKNQLDTGEYVGGIAYTVKLEDLAAGESQTVYPSHFDPEYGVVMMVRTY